MRWTRYEDGEVRERSAFLWWPKEIAGESRWLERARWTEQYLVKMCPPGVDWEPISWVTDESIGRRG